MADFDRAYIVEGNEILDARVPKKGGNVGENIVTSLSFTFSDKWEGASKTIVFKSPKKVLLTPIALVNDAVDIPVDALDAAGTLQFSLQGTFANSSKVIRTPIKELDVNGTLPYTGGTPIATYTNVVSECQDATVLAETATLAANQAAASAAEIDAQARAAEAERERSENARNVFEPYNAATAYVVGNKVTYLGSSYLCILASTGNLPTNGTYWMLIASKGDKGNTGDAGEMTIGTVTTLAPGEPATVTNTGTTTDAVLDIAIPAGYDGSAVPIDDASSAVDRVLSASYIKGKLSAIEDAFIEEGSAWA